MKQQKMLNTNKGITLIALVITIIVMLILVAVTISMAVNGGLFEYAGKATGETNNAIKAEQELGSGKITIDNQVYNSIDEYINSAKGNEVEEDGEEFTELYTETKSYTDKNGKIAMIPKGFSVGTSEGINTIADGLVIQDAEENQFVWIPVEYTASGTVDENGLDSGFLNVFQRNYLKASDFAEPYENGYTNPDGTTEADDYYKMMLSVQENKGFYIGRFEAGTEEPRYSEVENGTDKLVVKRDVYPYNNVGWSNRMDDYIEECIKEKTVQDENGEWKDLSLNQGYGAVYLSKHLLDGQTTDAVSTLCYGVQWDAMLNFISDKYDLSDCTKWGNYNNSGYIIKRKAAQFAPLDLETYNLDEWEAVPTEGKSKTNSEMMLLTTGASDDFSSKNIFDVAGNVLEWTNVAYWKSCRVYAGGCYQAQGNSYTVKVSSEESPDSTSDAIGFRVALYVL